MKKFIFIMLTVIALVATFSICVSAETVFETEKLIKCEDVYNTPMVSTVYDNSLGSSVYYSLSELVSDPAEITAPEMSFTFNVPEDGLPYKNYKRTIYGTLEICSKQFAV